MSLVDVFSGDGFTMASMLTALDKVERVPTQIGDMGVFVDRPVATEIVQVEERNGAINLIQTTQRGAPATSKAKEKRNLRNFNSVRIAIDDAIQASELAFLRQFGTEDQMIAAAQAEVFRRLEGQNGLVADIELTKENMRLGALKGILLDADGSTIYNYYTEFGLTPPTAVTLNTTSLTGGNFRAEVQDKVVRYYRRNGKGVRIPAGGIIALCGDEAFDNLNKSAEFREAVINHEQAAELRGSYDGSLIQFAGVQWAEYDGTDDNSTVALSPTEVRFFPAGQSGAMEVAWSPGEKFADLGQMGESDYVEVLPHKSDEYVELKGRSYPLYIAKRPDLLVGGTVVT